MAKMNEKKKSDFQQPKWRINLSVLTSKHPFSCPAGKKSVVNWDPKMCVNLTYAKMKIQNKKEELFHNNCSGIKIYG